MVWIGEHIILVFTTLAVALHLIGLMSSIDALFWARTSQSAIAWAFFLVTFPYVALPVYWMFGRTRFRGYSELLRRFSEKHASQLKSYRDNFKQHFAKAVPLALDTENTFEKIAGSEFTHGNVVTLLIDGEATFEAIFSAMQGAQSYVLIQFFIVRSDGLGQRLKDEAIRCVQRGVRVYLLYDEIGSAGLSSAYIRELTEAGVKCSAFGTRKGIRNFFQVNFRNHRKIVVVDGIQAFVGGHNVGDEYLGKSKSFGRWRDTHLWVRGPAVISIQEPFITDWVWATETLLDVKWVDPPEIGPVRVLSVATGPSDEPSRCLLLFLEIIRSAKRRLWIASPYFVPDESTILALQLAAKRGVDVRILLPKNPDHMLVWLASFAYISDVRPHGIRLFRYEDGFLHEKVMLVDDALSVVGTANFDNRSFRLNFEISVLVADLEFAKEIERMFNNDFERSSEELRKSWRELPKKLHIGSRIARLFSPIL